MVTDHTESVRTIRSAGTLTLAYDGKSAVLEPDDLVITETPKSGWSVASHAGESVALDLELTPALIQSGLVREIIRAIQEERKNSDFDISDRITVSWNGTEEVIAAIAAQSEFICSEVLARAISRDEALTITDAETGIALSLRKSL